MSSFDYILDDPVRVNQFLATPPAPNHLKPHADHDTDHVDVLITDCINEITARPRFHRRITFAYTGDILQIIDSSRDMARAAWTIVHNGTRRPETRYASVYLSREIGNLYPPGPFVTHLMSYTRTEFDGIDEDVDVNNVERVVLFMGELYVQWLQTELYQPATIERLLYLTLTKLLRFIHQTVPLCRLVLHTAPLMVERSPRFLRNIIRRMLARPVEQLPLMGSLLLEDVQKGYNDYWRFMTNPLPDPL